jgi:hypothetical protein
VERWTSVELYGFVDGDALARVTYEMVADGWGGFGERRAVSAERLGPAPRAPSPIPCADCGGEGDGIRGVGEYRVCATCRGSGRARCTVCCKGDAVLDDGAELVCSGCVAETLAADLSDRIASEAVAILLPVLTYAAMRVALAVSLERMRRTCITPPPPDFATPLPAMSQRDPDSATWRAVRATSIDTVRPMVSA